MNNIRMNAEMTKAILEGCKTQTRRIIKEKLEKPTDSKFPENGTYLDSYNNTKKWYWWTKDGRQSLNKCIKAKYQKDEVIWVREPARVVGDIYYDAVEVEYVADGKKTDVDVSRLKNSEKGISNYPEWIYKQRGIPNGCIKEMARIFLKITDVRVEKLQDISDGDIKQEGVLLPDDFKKTMMWSENQQMGSGWIELWDKTAPKGHMWEDNPYVFVYEFERCDRD